jgi:type IV pilus assembly protein PilE
MINKKLNQGMTLIELMIVVAIIAITAGIGFPTYQQYLTKARRVDAQTVLIEAAQFMERYYTANHRYHQDLDGVAVALPATLLVSPVGSDTKYYDISINAVSASSFSLTATPKGSQADDGILTVNSLGVKAWDKNNNAAIEASESCWVKKCG